MPFSRTVLSIYIVRSPSFPSLFVRLAVRMMWRADGQGEAYLYVDDRLQASDFCDAPTVCDPRAGTSFLRGAFTFKRGEWNRIALTGKKRPPFFTTIFT